MDNYSQRIAALSPEQQELLKLKMKMKEFSQLKDENTEPSSISGERDQQEDLHPPLKKEQQQQNMLFSIFCFPHDKMLEKQEKYKLLFDIATFADIHNFSAIWVPERHFQHFGGLYPNPTVLAAALAMVTKRLQIRAGSLVLPLHNAIRVAEDWSIIDNLSQGRVAISFASGWHPTDFVLAPGIYEMRKDITFEGITAIQKLWAGEAIQLPDGAGVNTTIRIKPEPIQKMLPTWVTASGNPATWVKAGELGANVLASLIGQTFEELSQKIELYRDARVKCGFAPATGNVTLMLHTFIGEDNDIVKEQVRGPLSEYIASFIEQYEKSSYTQNIAAGQSAKKMKEELVNFAFERYFNANSLLGTLPKCRAVIHRLCQIGVNEVACLVDFGLDTTAILQSLEYLKTLMLLDGKTSTGAAKQDKRHV